MLRAAAVSVAVNLVASIAFVEAFGLVGVFWGTIVGTLSLAALLGPRIRAIAGGHNVISAAVRAAVPPTVAAAVGAAIGTAMPGADWIAATAAVGLGGVAAAVAATRWSFAPGESRELVGALTGQEPS